MNSTQQVEVEESIAMMKPKNIVIVSLNAVGHVNGCLGATFQSFLLKNKKYFNVYFLLEKAFEGKLKPLGYQEIIYDIEDIENEMKTKTELMKPGEQMAQDLLKYKIIGKLTIDEQLENLLKHFGSSPTMYQFYRKIDQKLKELSCKIQIDLFMVDDSHPHPFMYYSKIPIIRCLTGAPFIHAMDPDLPPPFTGLPSNTDPLERKRYLEKIKNLLRIDQFDQFLVELGYKPLPPDWNYSESTERIFLTIYSYPKELNHWKIETKSNWFNFEVFNKIDPYQSLDDENSTPSFDLKQLVGKKFFEDNLDGKFSGKWIYFSLGSMGSIDLELMNRLIKILSKTSHKFIISKGPKHSEINLSRNMWGDRYLPQLQLIPLMDLIITHGGNNTFTETFARGKPMLVMPLFCDQLDNAQRLLEMNYGLRFNPYDFDENNKDVYEQKLINSIEKLLNDQQLKKRLQKASERIQKNQSHELFVKLILEKLF